MITIGTISSSDKSVPDAPTIGTATDIPSGRAFNNGRGDVTFTAPTYTGRLPITGYTVTSNPGGFTGTGSASPITVTGLQSATAYTFTVTGTNSVGNSTSSSASNSITATTIPQAPTIGAATDGGTGTTVSVAFTGNATGGSAITGYTATSSPGGLTGTGASSPITVSGLTAGTAYTFTVTATNANGTSAASAASNSVTPAVPTSYESIATFTGNGTASSFTFSSIPSTYKSLQIRFNGITSGGGGRTGIRINGDSGSNYNYHAIYGFNDAATATNSATTAAYLTGFQIGPGTQGPTVIVADLTDYASTSKNKTIRAIAGCEKNLGTGNSEVDLTSALWRNTTAINSITLFNANSIAWDSGTSVALYGIRG